VNHFDISDIKERVQIWDVVNHFGHVCPEACVAIKSPLREERHPSFSIFANGQAAKDHSTGDSYDVISLYEELAGCSKHDAIVGCGNLGGLSSSDVPSNTFVPPPPKSRVAIPKDEKPRFRDRLGPYDKAARSSMIDNAREDIDDPSSTLRKFCHLKEFTEDFIKEMIDEEMIGVLKHPELREQSAIAWMFYNDIHGHGCKIRFRADSSRGTFWWKGKSQQFIYGDRLGKGREEGTPVIVTEGESDCLTLLQLKIPAFGITGSEVAPEAPLCYNLMAHTKVGIWYDADKAGRGGAKMISEYLKNESSATIVPNIGDKTPEGFDIGKLWEKYRGRFALYAKNEYDKITTWK
jgi:5S rRNA maturation endonuclease (ribonuclease M5)